jgi:hypothetical protein
MTVMMISTLELAELVSFINCYISVIRELT